MSDPQAPPPPPAPAPQADPPAKKKGMGPLAWVAIGCGVIVLIGILAVTAGGLFVAKKVKDIAEDVGENPIAASAEMFVKVNPELEMVESDREAGKITVREKSTGKVVTFNYEDIESGQFSFESDDGETTSVDFSQAGEGGPGAVTVTTDEGTATWGNTGAAVELPDWLPEYNGTTADVGGYASSNDTTRSGSYIFTTSDEPSAVLEFYEKVMNDLDLETSRTSYSGGGNSVESITGRSDGQSITVTVSSSAEGRQVNILYEGPA